MCYSTVENDAGIICACLPALAPLKDTRLFGKIIPSSLQYFARRSGYDSQKGSSSRGSSSKVPAKRIGYQLSESGTELVDAGRVNTDIANAGKVKTHISTQDGREGKLENGIRAIRRDTEVDVSYSRHRDPASLV